MSNITTLRMPPIIRVTDRVRLLSGGQVMVVSKLVDPTKEHMQMAQCYWADALGRMWSWNVPTIILEIVDSDDSMTAGQVIGAVRAAYKRWDKQGELSFMGLCSEACK